ncbi:MAG: 3-deoxy-7-phosphoheptulonate synthase [Candidatus Wallbacteria bacterium]
MLIITKENAGRDSLDALLSYIAQNGFNYCQAEDAGKKIISVELEDAYLHTNYIESFDCIEKVVVNEPPYKNAVREPGMKDTAVKIGESIVGGGNIALIAGPCSIESAEQAGRIAEKIAARGIKLFRGGIYKPRTSPYSFQGLAAEGIEILKYIRTKYKLGIVTELLDVRHIEKIYDTADVIQIGSRNAMNYELLKEAGKLDKPVLLKRGMSSSIKEFLLSAEYILCRGNKNVILCERGIRTFENSYRNTLDITAIPIIKDLSHLPIIVDPSHSCGKWNYIGSLSLAAVAAGSDGVMIEVHDRPEEALSDAEQALKPERLDDIILKISEMAKLLNKKFDCGIK